MTKTTRETSPLGIIWINYNSDSHWELAARSLKSIIQSDGVHPHIIVVDNASTDGSLRLIEQFISENRQSLIEMVQSKVNRGFAGGNNIGYHRLPRTAKYFALVNNDLIVCPSALHLLLQYMDSNMQVGAVQGRLMNFDNDLDNAGQMMNEILESEPGKNITSISPVSYVSGAFALYRTDAVQRIVKNGSLFDEDMFAFFDDKILGIRLWENGYSSLCLPIIAGYHKGSQSLNKLSTKEYLIYRAWLTTIWTSNCKYRLFIIMTSWRLILIGLGYTIIYRNPRQIIAHLRAFRDGTLMGRQKNREGLKLDVSKCPLYHTNRIEAVFALLGSQTRSFLRRRAAQTEIKNGQSNQMNQSAGSKPSTRGSRNSK